MDSRLPSQDYRYERKFLVDRIDSHLTQSLIKSHPAMFFEPYPPRFVNNFYLDSPGMRNFDDNVGGAANRRKVRIRWYGQLFGEIESPVLEIKTKRGLVGAKRGYPIPGFELGAGFQKRHLQNLVRNSDVPDNVKFLLRDLDVVLLNRYLRRYYASKDGRYRLTLDTDLVFYRVASLSNWFAHRQVDYRTIILELKYKVEHDDLSNKISGFFPFRMTKSSKYVQGIERVFL